MKHDHDKPRRTVRAAEPVQVYLDPADRERLDRLTDQLDATKSDVLRRGLAALEAQNRRTRSARKRRLPLPSFNGQGLQPGVDLDDAASLLDLMDENDAAH